MRTPSSDIGVPIGEPKDGDFVAYLAQIERRQLAALATPPAHTPPSLTGPHTPQRTHAPQDEGPAPLSATEAEQLRARLQQDAGQLKRLVVPALLGLFGVFLLIQGLVGDAGIVALLIGTFLLWRAAAAVRKATAPGGRVQRDLAARLIGTLREAQKRK
jgi:hypothetical protein